MNHPPDEPMSTAERIIVGVVGILVLATILTPVLGSIWDWSNMPDNRNGMEVTTAVLQVVGTLILLFLTWRADNTSRKIAYDAQKQSAEESQRARQNEEIAERERERQRILSTLPVITFQDPEILVPPFASIRFTVSNVGVGAALAVSVNVQPRIFPCSHSEEGAFVNLSPHESTIQYLHAEYSSQVQIQVDGAWRDSFGWLSLFEITANYKDVRGFSWVHTDTLSLHHENDSLGFTNPTFMFPS